MSWDLRFEDRSAAGGAERWRLSSVEGAARVLDMDVTVGKHLDVIGLKGTDLDDVRSYAATLQAKAERMYGAGAPLVDVASCPCCASPSADAREVLRVLGVPYVRCGSCAHAFVPRQPSEEAIEEHFRTAAEYSAAYVDKAAADLRLDAVVMPKLRWLLEQFARQRGREVASLADVGAGAGHFIEGARRAGVSAVGYELSEASRAFAREAFDIDLEPDFFSGSPARPFDVVTMWGLLEYTPAPGRFLERARRLIDADGMLVVEVPRFDCGSTAAQAAPGAVVARHLDPTSHVNCFSDSSLAALLVRHGFVPVAAWYFGMDAYELLVQAALAAGAAEPGPADWIPAMQRGFDLLRQCDDLVMAAVPDPAWTGSA